VAPHPGRAHLVDREPGLGAELPAAPVGIVHPDVLAARRLEHLPGRRGHVLAHGELVVAPGAVDLEERDAEIVGLVGQLHVIVLARQTLPESSHAHGPGAAIVQWSFQLHAEPALARAAAPSLPAGAALVAEAAHVVAAGGVV